MTTVSFDTAEATAPAGAADPAATALTGDGRPPGAAPSASRTGLIGETWPRFLLALGLAVVLPWLLGSVGVLNDSRALALGTGASFAVAGLSLNVLMGYTGQLSLGHFALVGAGAFTAAKITAVTELRLPWIVGLVAAAVVGGLIGCVLGLPALRIRGLYLAIVTVGFQYAMEQSILQWDVLAAGSAGVELPRPYVGSFGFTDNAHYLALIAPLVVLVWLVDTHITSTRVGRAFQAVRADEDVAASFGISVERTKLLAFTISGVFAGIAGSMYGHLIQFGRADVFRFQTSLLLVVIVVIGGLGSRVGVVSAAVFFGVTPEILDAVLGDAGDDWELIVGAGLLLFTVAKNPAGLAGAVREKREHRAEKEARARAGAGPAADAIPRLPSLPRPSGLPARRAVSGPVLVAADVTVDFGGVRAVDHADLTVERNRIVGLVGPNGAGKTTLFNAVSGAVRPTSGRITFAGIDVSSLSADARAGLGMARTFQSIGLARQRSVTENLLMAQHLVAGYPLGVALAGVGAAPRMERELRARAAETVAALGFADLAESPVADLSGGQQRIVELACALVTAPELVMLDEPSAGMAPAAVENLAERLRDMRDDLGRTLLLIEHNIPLVLDVCDEVYVMASGAIIAHGSPAEVLEDPAVVSAYLGDEVPA